MPFLRWIWQAPRTNSQWEAFVGKFFHTTLLITFPVLASMFVVMFSTQGFDLSRIPILSSISSINLIAFIMLKTGRLRPALQVFIWGTWALIAYSSFSSIGVYTPAYLVCSLLILVTALGLNRRNAVALTIMVIIYGIFLLYGHSQGWVTTPTNHNINPLNMWITTSAIFALIAYIVTAVRQTSFDMTERLQRDEALYRAIVEDQTEFIVRWKAGGIRTFANSAYLRYFGISLEQALGTNFFPQINEDDRAWVNEKIARLSPENPIDIAEHRVIRPDGTEGWQAWSDRALYDEDGNLVEYQSVGRDITAIKELEIHQRELNLSKEREAFLRDFLSTMSHDLQTPLSVMRTNLYMLKRNPSNIEDRVEKIDKQIDKLSGMIGDILTVARLEHLPELERSPNDVAALLESSINPLRDEAKAKNIGLEIPALLPSAIMQADATEFQRALSNLIGNAIKYTPEGGKVKIDSYQDANKLIIEVIDTGIGIEAQDLPHIFERFYRAKNAQSFEKGTGLGLAIVKRIIELHDGTISASSKAGEGSRFTIHLPLAQESMLA